MGKKKGYFLCEVDTGADEPIGVVSPLANMSDDMKVILAPVGSTVDGVKVESGFVHGDMSHGVIIGYAALKWKGDPNHCIALKGSCKVGKPAPASKKSPLVFAAGKGA